jgi:monoterpene epsilon-lactone hydrolase
LWRQCLGIMWNRLKNFLVKFFFRITKYLIFHHDYQAEHYRKGMEWFTSFLGYPRNRMRYESFREKGIDAEWAIPDNLNNDRVILYLHGGGYAMGSVKSHRPLVTRISLACASKVFSLNYRLAPEYPFPCAVEDAVSAYRHLRELGILAEQIIIAGDSAGGGLTVATLVSLRDSGIELPLAAVCLSPWMDLEGADPRIIQKAAEDPFIDLESIQIWGKRYAGDALRNPLASPKYADLSGLCPILVQVGTSEILYYDALTLREHCLRDGVPCVWEEYPGMIHVFQTFGGFLDEADLAIERIAHFIRSLAENNIPVMHHTP